MPISQRKRMAEGNGKEKWEGGRGKRRGGLYPLQKFRAVGIDK